MLMPMFATWVDSGEQARALRMLIASIREFGGEMRGATVLVMELGDGVVPDDVRAEDGVWVRDVRVGEDLRDVWYAGKVAACAKAEELALAWTRSLTLLIPECLVVRPPELLVVDDDHQVAVRPVHISNVGSPAGEPPDGFWRGVYRLVGGESSAMEVESFIDGVRLRPYFNTAAFSIAPSRRLMAEWLHLFRSIATDDATMREHCADDLHRVFLHQAVLCALLPARVEPSRLRVLPPDYGYPYNLHGDVPTDRRAETLNELTIAIYEQRSVDPELAVDIRIDEPLRSWLVEQHGR